MKKSEFIIKAEELAAERDISVAAGYENVNADHLVTDFLDIFLELGMLPPAKSASVMFCKWDKEEEQ